MAETLHVGERLNESTALQLAADLNLLEPQADIILDFSATTHYEPFAMLLVSSAVNRLRRRAGLTGQTVTVSPAGIDPEGIAGHMGFWQSMGFNVGRTVNSPAHKSTYLPLTRIEVADLYKESGGANPLASGVIEHRAQSLAAVLAEAHGPALLEALTYSLRELIRNVIEHAMTPTIWVAGMSWPKRNYVQIAVLDEGRGIRASLGTNKQYRVPTDIDALRAALSAGTSRNAGCEPSREQLERWAAEGHNRPMAFFANAGYGLYMISTFCREAGQFLLASGNASLAYVGSGEIQTATAHHGTALRLVLYPTEAPAAWDRLFEGELPRGPAGKRPLLTASTLKRLGLDSLSGNSGESSP